MNTPLVDMTTICQCTHDIHVVCGGVWGIVAKLWKAIIEIPIDYQDEAGFHVGVKSAEKEVKRRQIAKNMRKPSNYTIRRRARLFWCSDSVR